MAGYKLLKRKGIDHVPDDFYDFPLSSPATKIRRLDGELPPIAEVELEHEQPLPISAEAEADASPPPNAERALVIFKPLMHSSSPFSLTLDSDLLSRFKREAHWSKGDSDCERLIKSAVEKEEQDKRNRGMAIVPWAPSSNFAQGSNIANTEMMEADHMGPEPEEESSVMMDVENQQEENNSHFKSSSSMLNLSNGGGVLVGGVAATPEGFNQQQHHCLWPHLPQNMSTPITWTLLQRIAPFQYQGMECG
ncbi:hypothetical protein AAHE18_03G199000 [Arachis hypogaea]|nr:uncharacterized protein LOC112790710 [Arachis hypogaea]XP_025689030.1 uncharacterized protein LOC112790710 [Arachis hypogaea]